MACFPIAHWYVLRGDWLCSGKGMHDASTPKIVLGWISQCVCLGPMPSGRMATNAAFCSAASMYSITVSPLALVISESHDAVFRKGTNAPSTTLNSGRTNRPPSLHSVNSLFW